ncbi:Hsp20/alpha crystallin family protein [Mailhella sp.]|uniref:Hsp20/alpha crystallin family protein n=1 Tax=Mailhella sp. TaxID=1981029 RepID=UPI003AB89244
MKDISLVDGPILFRQIFYTTAMVYDRREQEPFPPVNVYFCGEKILVQALLPGLELKDIRLSLEQDGLLLEGCVEREKGHYLHEERYSGKFKRKIILGKVLASRVAMRLKDGILHIELQKRT